MREILLNHILPAILPVLIPLISAGLLWILKSVGTLLSAKAQQSKAMNVASSTYELVRAIVEHVERHMRDEVQKKLADGKLDKAEADELKAMAMKLVKEAIGEHGRLKLQSIFGSSVDFLISGWIERAVKESKVAAPAPVLANPS